VQQDKRPKRLRKCNNTNSKHGNLILEFLNVGLFYSRNPLWNHLLSLLALIWKLRKESSSESHRRNQRMDTLNFIPDFALLRSWKMFWVFLKRRYF
jgi:hypothetical protein